jgi:hypothetical protein
MSPVPGCHDALASGGDELNVDQYLIPFFVCEFHKCVGVRLWITIKISLVDPVSWPSGFLIVCVLIFCRYLVLIVLSGVMVDIDPSPHGSC